MFDNVKKNVKVRKQEVLLKAQRNLNRISSIGVRKAPVTINGLVVSVKEALDWDYR